MKYKLEEQWGGRPPAVLFWPNSEMNHGSQCPNAHRKPIPCTHNPRSNITALSRQAITECSIHLLHFKLHIEISIHYSIMESDSRSCNPRLVSYQHGHNQSRWLLLVTLIPNIYIYFIVCEVLLTLLLYLILPITQNELVSRPVKCDCSQACLSFSTFPPSCSKLETFIFWRCMHWRPPPYLSPKSL
jgi:hypothetical protein